MGLLEHEAQQLRLAVAAARILAIGTRGRLGRPLRQLLQPQLHAQPRVARKTRRREVGASGRE